MKKIFQEFKNFALKGNLFDIAVGFVIGAAFTRVSNSFIQDIVMPPISLLTGRGIEGEVILRDTSEGVAQVVIKYGDFLSAGLNFLVVAFVMFLVVKTINKIKHEEEQKPSLSTPSKTEQLLEEIRDSLKNKN